jgi:hypothetical protein
MGEFLVEKGFRDSCPSLGAWVRRGLVYSGRTVIDARPDRPIRRSL